MSKKQTQPNPIKPNRGAAILAALSPDLLDRPDSVIARPASGGSLKAAGFGDGEPRAQNVLFMQIEPDRGAAILAALSPDLLDRPDSVIPRPAEQAAAIFLLQF